jgi:hypothetical protein
VVPHFGVEGELSLADDARLGTRIFHLLTSVIRIWNGSSRMEMKMGGLFKPPVD